MVEDEDKGKVEKAVEEGKDVVTFEGPGGDEVELQVGKIETRKPPAKLGEQGKWESKLYSLPLIGSFFLKKRIEDGAIVAEVIKPNRQSEYRLVDMRSTSFKVEISDEKEKYFIMKPIKESPSDYIRNRGRIPIATFDWETSMPVPMRSKEELPFDFEYFNDLMKRARLAGAASELMDYFEKFGVFIKFVIFLVMSNIAIQLAIHWEMI